MLRSFGSNPENPKKVQISFMAVIGMLEFLNMLDATALSSEDKKAYEFIRHELEDKKAKVRNRQAFAAVIRAQGADEKRAAIESYRATKALNP